GEVQHAHAVADAEERHRQLEQFSGDLRRVFLIHARRTAGENDSLRPERADFFQRQIERADLAINLGLANAASDELRVLGTEIEDEDHSTLEFGASLVMNTSCTCPSSSAAEVICMNFALLCSVSTFLQPR